MAAETLCRDTRHETLSGNGKHAAGAVRVEGGWWGAGRTWLGVIFRYIGRGWIRKCFVPWATGAWNL